MSFPTKQVGGILVRLLYSHLYGSKYKCIQYQCDQASQVDMCFAYKSHSEGLWRLAMDNSQFLKGSDYVTTTQVHMDVQCFFDEYESTLSKPPDPALFEKMLRLASASSSKGYLLTHNVERKVRQPTTIMSNYIRLNSHLLVKRNSREYIHPVFFPLVALCEKHTDLYNSYTIITTLRNPELHPKTKELSNFNEMIRIPYFSKESTIRYYTEKVKQSYKSNLRRLTNIPRDPFFGKMIELIQTMPEEADTTAANNNIYVRNIKVARMVIELYSNYMKYFFTTGPEPSVLVCTLQMPLPMDSVSSVIPYHVYKRQLRFLREGLLFDLYYATYTMPEASGYSGTFKTILNLLPSPSLPGPLGLNEVYISAGIYVYKPFEYNGKFISKYTEGKYAFIGDFLTHMWPLEEVHEGGPSGEGVPPIFYSSLAAEEVPSLSSSISSSDPSPATWGAASATAGVPPPPREEGGPSPATWGAPPPPPKVGDPGWGAYSAALGAPPPPPPEEGSPEWYPPWEDPVSGDPSKPVSLFGGPWRTSSPFRGGKTLRRKRRQTKKH